jgi:signal peptidase I
MNGQRPWRRVARRLSTACFWIALCAAVVFVTGMVAASVTHARVQPVLSGSMTPTIPRYSLIVARPVRTDQIRVGDVVVFQPPAGYPLSGERVMHRVVSLQHLDGATVMQTKGDANPGADPWKIDLTHSAVYRTSIAVPYLGAVLMFAHNTDRVEAALPLILGVLMLVAAAGLGRRLRPVGSPAGRHRG